MKNSCARKVIFAALVSLVLTGCFDDDTTPAETVRDVEWFKAHDDHRQSTLAECTNNPGELKDSPNCANAREAELQLSAGDLHNVDNW